MNDFSDLTDEKVWAPLIGRFVIAFGKIENATLSCVRAWSDSVMYPHIVRLPLKPRLELVKDLVVRSGATEAQSLDFQSCIRDITTLVELRNVVVHNALVLIVYLDTEAATDPEPAIAAAHKDRHITLREMIDLTEKAEQYERRLSKICGSIWANRITPDDLTYLSTMQFPFRKPSSE